MITTDPAIYNNGSEDHITEIEYHIVCFQSLINVQNTVFISYSLSKISFAIVLSAMFSFKSLNNWTLFCRETTSPWHVLSIHVLSNVLGGDFILY